MVQEVKDLSEQAAALQRANRELQMLLETAKHDARQFKEQAEWAEQKIADLTRLARFCCVCVLHGVSEHSTLDDEARHPTGLSR